MGIWRCFLSIMILVLIMFPPSWISSNFLAKAGESQTLSDRVPLDTSCSNVTPFATNLATPDTTCLSFNQLEEGTSNYPQFSENWLDFVSRKLRGLLWGVTRGIQRHPLKAWLAELEMNSPSRSEEVTIEVEPNAIV